MTHSDEARSLDAPPEPSSRSIWQLLGAGGGDTQTDLRNNRALALWSFAWAAGIIAATSIVASGLVGGPAAWVVALAPNLLALFVLRAYLRFLAMTDELQRRIQLEALAVGFGVTYFLAIAHVVAQSAGAPALDSTWWVLVFTAGLLLGHKRATRRYR